MFKIKEVITMSRYIDVEQFNKSLDYHYREMMKLISNGEYFDKQEERFNAFTSQLSLFTEG